MKKQFFFLLLFLPLALCAQVLTPETALQRMHRTASCRNLHRSAFSASLPDYELVRTVEAAGQPAVYLFQPAKGEGFLMLAAEAGAYEVLAYSEEGLLDANHLPAPMEQWMQQYAAEIAQYRATTPMDFSALTLSSTRPSRANVAPLCKTFWGQRGAFNLYMPKVEKDGAYEDAPTGCVATALAQIMKVHAWPATGEGTHSYYWSKGAQTLSFDYGNTSFNWGAMQDYYVTTNGRIDENSTAVKEVAKLMQAIGYAIDMNYGIGGSGAETPKVPEAIVDHFRYDRSVHIAEREWFSMEAWENLIYSQLQEGLPMLYYGWNDDGTASHAYVLDGYKAPGLYHFNFGWDGNQSGYYALSAICPEAGGAGRLVRGYSNRAQMVYNIRPKRTGSPDALTEMVTSNNFGCTATKVNNTTFTLAATGGYINRTRGAITGSLGFCIQKQQATGAWGTPEYTEAQNFSATRAGETVGTSFSANVSFAQGNGVYKVTPAHRTSTGQWQEVHVKYDRPQCFLFTLSNGTLTRSDAPLATPTVQLTRCPNAFYNDIYKQNIKRTVRMLVTNTDVEKVTCCNLRGYVVDANNEHLAVGATWYNVELYPGEANAISYSVAYNPIAASGGGGTGGTGGTGTGTGTGTETGGTGTGGTTGGGGGTELSTTQYFRVALCNADGEFLQWITAPVEIWYGVRGTTGDTGDASLINNTAAEEAALGINPEEDAIPDKVPGPESYAIVDFDPENLQEAYRFVPRNAPEKFLTEGSDRIELRTTGEKQEWVLQPDGSTGRYFIVNKNTNKKIKIEGQNSTSYIYFTPSSLATSFYIIPAGTDAEGHKYYCLDCSSNTLSASTYSAIGCTASNATYAHPTVASASAIASHWYIQAETGEAPAEGLRVEETSLTLVAPQTGHITATAPGAITYTSSRPDLVEVDANGNLTTHESNEGSVDVVITVSSGAEQVLVTVHYSSPSTPVEPEYGASVSNGTEPGSQRYLTTVTTTGATQNLNYTNGTYPGASHYMDATSHKLRAAKGQEISLTFVGIGGSDGMQYTYCRAWADWNGDREFHETNEVAFEAGRTNNPSPDFETGHTVTFTIPASATTGSSRLRMVFVDAWEEGMATLHPVGETFKGFTIDFDLEIVEGGGETPDPNALTAEEAATLAAIQNAMAHVVAPGEKVGNATQYYITAAQKSLLQAAVSQQTRAAVQAATPVWIAMQAAGASATPFVAGKIYKITNAGTGTYSLKVTVGMTGNSVGAAPEGTSPDEAQRWMILPVGSQYVVYNLGASAVLHAEPLGTSGMWRAISECSATAQPYINLTQDAGYEATSWRLADNSYTDSMPYLALSGTSVGFAGTTGTNIKLNVEYVADATDAQALTGTLAAHAVEEVKTDVLVRDGWGYASLYNSRCNLLLPEGYAAWTFAETAEHNVLATKSFEAGQVIPAGTGVVLQGLAADALAVPATTKTFTGTPPQNLLKGTDAAQTVYAAAGATLYMLSYTTTDGVGFYKASSTGASFQNGAHKAYLELPSTAVATRAFLFDEMLDVTSLQPAIINKECDAPRYDLSGRRLTGKPASGLYIQNGKKIMVK